MQFFDGSVTSPQGIWAAGVAAGIKKTGAKDLALVRIDGLGTSASVFTRNQVKGHSLQRSLKLAGQEQPVHAIVINSGNANACVGERGAADAEALARKTAELLGLQPEHVMTCSTGVIGIPLPLSAVEQGIEDAAGLLSRSTEAGHDACEAIMTTDKVMKEAAVVFEAGGKNVVLAGMAKGSGMIHPNMATMISVITTDMVVDRDFMDWALRQVVNKTFNRVSVDGDTSVCDTAILVSSGMAENEPAGFGPDRSLTEDARLFLQALEMVCMKLARIMAADGEGATKLIDVRVNGAADEETAYQVALSVARSPLFKTAMFGEDPNWGRILTAVGYAPVPIDPNRVDIAMGPLKVCERGEALPFDEDEASEILAQDEIVITIDLNSGIYSDHYWTCDFSYDYVKINGSYRS